MQRLRICLATGILFFLSFSCIDRDILNISDSLEINSRYSVPVGEFDYDINDYLESLSAIPFPTHDSLYFEDILYPNFASVFSFGSVDTFAFNLVRDPSEKVNSIEFVILVSNGYPTEAAAQVYFLSGTSPVAVDSVFSSGPVAIEPADIDSEGLVTNPSASLFRVTLPPGFIQKLSQISGIMVEGRVNTTRPDIRKVKFYRNYQINVHIGSRIELLFDAGEI